MNTFENEDQSWKTNTSTSSNQYSNQYVVLMLR